MATTSEDVWRLLAELATAQKETDKQLKETDLLLKEVSQQQKENAQQQKETDRQLKETDRQQKETERRQQETDRQLKELGRQIGGLGAKFGSFTEGLALPSMETILRQRFGMKVVSPSVRASEDGQHLEIDVLAYTNGDFVAHKNVLTERDALADLGAATHVHKVPNAPHFLDITVTPVVRA